MPRHPVWKALLGDYVQSGVLNEVFGHTHFGWDLVAGSPGPCAALQRFLAVEQPTKAIEVITVCCSICFACVRGFQEHVFY